MNDSLVNSPHKNYIIRQIKTLLDLGRSHQSVIEGSLSIVKDQALTQKALDNYQQHQSLSKVFNDLGLLQLPSHLVKLLMEKESKNNQSSASYTALFQAEDIIQQSLQLFKVRLTTSLSYAVALSLLAVIVSAIIGNMVLPQFESILSGFGARLPAVTEFLMSWQASLFSPTNIGIVLFLTLLFVYLTILQIGKNQQLSNTNSRLPFLKQITQFVHNIRWLSNIKLLTSVGYSFAEIQQRHEPNKNLQALLPNLNNHLEAADLIGTLDKEIEFQTHQFSQSAERQVTKAARRLVLLVMGLIVSYIILIIFASYLPIFQLGEAL